MENKQADKLFVSNWIKKGGKLVFKSKQEESMFLALLKGMREGQTISFSVDFSDDQGKLSQISKLKAGIRELSNEIGETFIATENRVKKEAGLYDEMTETYKSFGNCSVSQLSSAIQVMIEQGDWVNLNLR